MARRKWLVLASLAVVVAAVAAMPYLLPLSRLIPYLERAIAQRIHQPVSIGTLRLFVLPIPHLQAGAISIGRYNLLNVDSITIHPRIPTLFSDTKVIREVEVRGVHMRSELLSVARTLIETSQRKSTEGDDHYAVRVEHATLRDVTVRFPGLVLSALNAEVRFREGKPAEIRASHQRDRLQLIARRQNAERWSIDIAGRDWRLPVGLPLQFDRLEGNATVTAAGIESKKLSGSLYGGSFSGPVAVRWKSGWSLAGQLQIEDLDLKPVVALVNQELALSGRLTAAPRFSSEAQQPAELLSALHLESDFSVADGVLHKVDLVAAAKNPLDRRAAKGGETAFEELQGHVVLDHGAYEFSDLNIASGLLKAQGDVTVLPDKKLTGIVRAELRNTGSIVGIPLAVGGTTRDPNVFPTPGAMAGAVAGTMLMPGLGTAVGMKAGELAERLFGRKKYDTRYQEPAQK